MVGANDPLIWESERSSGSAISTQNCSCCRYLQLKIGRIVTAHKKNHFNHCPMTPACMKSRFKWMISSKLSLFGCPSEITNWPLLEQSGCLFGFLYPGEPGYCLWLSRFSLHTLTTPIHQQHISRPAVSCHVNGLQNARIIQSGSSQQIHLFEHLCKMTTLAVV